MTFEPAEGRRGPAARRIRLLEDETEQRLLKDAFGLPDPGPACAAAPTLGKQLDSDSMLDLVLPVFSRLTPMQQAGMAYCLPNEVLADPRARSLRDAAVLNRRIEVWNSRSSNGAHFLPEIVDCLRTASGLTATQANDVRADSRSTGAANRPLADAEQPKFAQTLRLRDVEEQLPGLDPVFFELVEAKTLRQFLGLQDRFGILARMPDLDSLLNELLEALDQVRDAEQIQFSEPFWSTLPERDAITSHRLKPVRDRAPLSIRIKVWNGATHPERLLDEIASAVEQHQPVSEQADVLKRLRPDYLTLPGAAQLRRLLPLADRFSMYAAMDCDHCVLAEIAAAMQQEGQVTEERSPSREFWRCKAPAQEDPLFAIAPRYYKVGYWTERYQDVINALHGAVATNGLPQSSWTPAAVYGDNITQDDRRLGSIWEKRHTESERAKMLSARCAEKVALRFYQGLGHRVRDVASEQLTSTGQNWTTHDLELDRSQPVDVKNSRCQIHTDYYVAHEVKHKAAAGRQVRLATVLSPYLKIEYLDKPAVIPHEWYVPPVRMLGETVRADIATLQQQFVSPTFGFEVDVERLIPSWLPEFPSLYYASQEKHFAVLHREDRHPPEEAWEFLPIPPTYAFVRSGFPLPPQLADRLSPWQIDLAKRLQAAARAGRLSRPWLYLSILTDFLSALREPPDGFDPTKYQELVFETEHRQDVNKTRKIAEPIDVAENAGHPCGLHDPLRRIEGLCSTLTELWHLGDRNRLRRFTQFRLSNSDLLCARETDRAKWITLVAYCGGGKLNGDGVWIGRCLNYPLVFGREATCPECGKLICSECGFCTKDCPEANVRARDAAQSQAVLQAPQRCPDEILDPGYWECLEREYGDRALFDDEPPWANLPSW